MKKVLLITLLILIGIISCKKDKEGLPSFVIGNWKSQELTLWTQSEGQASPVGYYTISIKTDGTYVLTFEGYPCGDDEYAITEDKIYLNEFNFDPVWVDTPGPATFSVTWIPGETQMTWAGYAGSASTLPALIWTKQ